MINAAVTDLLQSSFERLQDAAPTTPEEARSCGRRLIAPSDEMARKQKELSQFLYDNFYNEYRVRRMRVKAQGYLDRMFRTLVGDPGLLAPADRARAERDGAERAVCDTIAGHDRSRSAHRVSAPV